MSSAPTAIKAVATCYVDLIVKESDNNVKLIVLDRLIDMKNPASEKVLQEMIMDILRVLSSPDLEVRRKTLSLTMDLISMRNVMDVVKYLEKVCFLYCSPISLSRNASPTDGLNIRSSGRVLKVTK